MSNNAPLSRLSDHRAVLLGCEAIGWLHMAGKAHPDFLRQHGGQTSGYKLKNWAQALVPDWDSTLSWLSRAGGLAWPKSLTEFLREFDRGGAKNALGLLQAAHAMASGIEKNHPLRSTRYLGQDTTHMWRTTAFGHPVRNLLKNPPDVLCEGCWEALLANIGKLLADLKELAEPASPHTEASVQSWWHWRQATIGPDGWLRWAFSQTLAETRIPNNDVTLWDQSYVAAALFKSAVAGVLLEGDKFKWDHNLKQNTRWRVLTVGLGAGHYEARAVRIGDWTGARREIERFFDSVCQCVEVELAVGSLLYRDDEVLAFSFPGKPVGRNDPEEDIEGLREAVQDCVDDLDLAKALDTPPVVRLSESTRSMIRMAREVKKARETLRVPLHRSWQLPRNEKGKGRHTCPVCGLRPNGSSESAREKKGIPCEPCRERRRGRLQDWLAGRVEGDSIWISEVADRHDRVALLTLSLDIAGWLEGEHVDSLRAQSLAEMLDANPGLRGYVSKESEQPDWEALTNAVTGYVSNPQKDTGGNKLSDPLLSSLSEGFRHESDLSAFFDKIVQDRADAPSWHDLEGHDARRAEWLAHQLFRKNASPGRVRRFWETTETFFSELLARFREITRRSANRWRVRRLAVTPASGTWTERQTYAGHFGAGEDAAPLEFVCTGNNQLVTICNLARVLGSGDEPGALRGKTLNLVDDEGRHGHTFDRVAEAPAPLGTYHPLIVLDRSPARFRLLVPLDAVDTCVQAAVEKWEVEMTRVWDRLPLRVGVVAFPRKLPYQAVVEAARNVEDDLARCGQETWRVHDVRTLDGVTALSLVRPDGEHQLVTVPVALPDGRPDVFYPYCAVGDVRIREPHDFAAPTWDRKTARHGTQVYRWMPELRPGDGVRVAPSRVARVFLDSTARRFEPVPVRYLGDWCAAREVWRRVQEAAPSLTAARALEAVLLEKREAWAFPKTPDARDRWLDFVRASLVNLWSVRGSALETFVDATRRDILLETLAWHLHVLKQDTES